MTAPRRERPWLEASDGKHECGPALADYYTLNLVHDGRPVRVQVPDYLEDRDRLEILATMGSGPLLTLIGYHAMAVVEPYEQGILMVARADSEGVFVVHVWHELYPWALKYLGLKENFVDG
jgi:hypothetical protein